MDFELSAIQKRIQKISRDFAEREVKPVASELDEKEEFPWDLVKKAARLGLMGVIIPREYGGGGLDTVSYAIIEEEISRVWASLGLIISANNSLSCAPIINFGSEEQKRKYLPSLAKGATLGAYALTEPQAGSDAANVQTSAVLEGELWVINGQKRFITNAIVADVLVLIARTGSERHKGLSAFIVEMKNTSGITVEKPWKKMGLHSSLTSDIIFENCRIPKENLLGQLGQGWEVAMATLYGGRINIAAQATGISQGAYEEALGYSKERIQFGKPISKFEPIREMLDKMELTIPKARELTWRAGHLKDEGRPFVKEASEAKLFASETAVQVSLDAIQIFGGYGYMKEYPVERFLRDAIATRIYEGTNQIQRIIIARFLREEGEVK